MFNLKDCNFTSNCITWVKILTFVVASSKDFIREIMYKHQLIDLLKSFSKKELMWFGQFLRSPYFNNRRMILKLFGILKKFYPEFESKNLTKQQIYKSLYGNKNYNDSTLRNLMSDLLMLALQFLKSENVQKEEVDSNFFLTNELAQRGLLNLYNNRNSQNEKIIISSGKQESLYFLNRFRIETDSFYMNLSARKVLKRSFVESESDRLINGIVYIMSYFVIESIKHNDTLLKYSRSYNIKKNINKVSNFLEIFNIEKMVSYIRNNSSLEVPVIEVYYNLLKAFINFDNDKFYMEFKKSLLTCSGNLGINDNHFLFGRLLDYCVLKKITGSNSSFDLDSEIFELHEIFVRREYYKTKLNSYMPFDLYRNVLINSITVKNLTYMEEFINKYTMKLNPEHITNVENYSYALLNFERGFFHEALQYLNRIKFDQFIYKIDMKNLSLKIYYELEQFESAISVIDTYKHFIKNNVLVSDNKRITHSNFINFTSNLIQYRTGSKKINLNYITEKIKNSKNTFNKEWILDKINEENRKLKRKAI